MSYRNVDISIQEVEKLIKERLSPVNGILTIENKSGNLFQLTITIPGQEKALINVYQTKKGLTFNPQVGKNQKLSEEFVKLIISGAKKAKPISQTLKSIHEELFNEFIENLEELGIEIISSKEDKSSKQFKLRNNFGHVVTIHYYISTESLLIQGYSTKIFKDVVLWFLDKTEDNPEEIIKIIFSSTKDFSKYEISFPDEIIEKALKDEVGSHYNNDKFIRETERKWLKVSYYLLEWERSLPDYYPSISAALKVIEGVLRRIILTRYGWRAFNSKSKAIVIFDFNDKSCKWRLKTSHRYKLTDEQIRLVENLYQFLKETRNRYSHNTGFPEHSELNSLEEAKNIFKEVISLLKPLKEAFPKGILK